MVIRRDKKSVIRVAQCVAALAPVHVIMLFDNQQELQKLNVSPSALIEEMAKNLN